MTTERTDIAVRGAASTDEPPERGVVRARLSLEGPAAAPVHESLVRALDRVRGTVESLHDPAAGPVTSWSTQAVRIWADRPWHERGRRLPLVHHASVALTVEFSDFAVLSRWVGEQVEGVESFAVDGVAWTLTDARRRVLEREVRAQAVREAAGRAQEYADALELGPVRPVAIADVGLLTAAEGIEVGAPRSAKAFAMAESAPELGFEPEDITVAAAVEARFVAG